jgi:hypothetical protein
MGEAVVGVTILNRIGRRRANPTLSVVSTLPRNPSGHGKIGLDAIHATTPVGVGKEIWLGFFALKWRSPLTTYQPAGI